MVGISQIFGLSTVVKIMGILPSGSKNKIKGQGIA
jgi:hypothetical protein